MIRGVLSDDRHACRQSLSEIPGNHFRLAREATEVLCLAPQLQGHVAPLGCNTVLCKRRAKQGKSTSVRGGDQLQSMLPQLQSQVRRRC